MIVTHNLYANNAQRQYKITEVEKKKSTEKLSSGYKINRSADDAAGLSISEKMRRLIRGLDQGSENIQDGISLCQVADGALAEVTSVLQRVRELSIQAYNGTNSKSDRACIQDEVDNCLLAIDEIKDRTKFNELYILRGNQHAAEDRFVRVQEPYMATKTDYEHRVIPDWLIINDGKDTEIRPRPDYNGNYTTDTGGIMYADYQYEVTDAAGNVTVKNVSVYYGDRKGEKLHAYGKDYIYINDFVTQNDANGFDWNLLFQNGKNTQLKDYVDNIRNTGSSGWTPGNTDNPSCKLDFGGLAAGTATVDDLFTNMFNLLGCEIGFPCGTCSDVNAVQFSGSIDSWTVNEFVTQTGYQSTGELSLSDNIFKWNEYAADGTVIRNDYPHTGYFGAISSLYAIEDETLRNTKAKELADAIAVDLKDRMETLLKDGMKDHFDRVASDNDPTKNKVLYIYDYRDNSALVSPADADTRVLNLISNVKRTITYEDIREYDVLAEKNRTYGIKIHCSANSYDSIPLLLQEISRDSLNLTDYSVNHYSLKLTCLHDLYQKELSAWHDSMRNLPYKIVTQEIQTTKVIRPPKYEQRAVNGEMKPVCIDPGEFEPGEVVQVQMKVPAGDVPERPYLKSTAEQAYDPSPLALIDEAIGSVTALRSYFGANQNRLEHAYANNGNAEENLQASESRIRDADIADEAVEYSLHSILEQAGQAMMAQANHMNQGVLTLLQ